MEIVEPSSTDQAPPSGGKVAPLISFGMIADVQYADIENRMNFTQTEMRYYRNSLKLLKEAVRAWNQSSEHIDFVIQLGDLLDGFNTEKGRSESDAKCRLLFAELEKCGVPVHHIIGNHELYNYNREELYERGFLSGFELSKNGRIRANYAEFSENLTTNLLNGVEEASFASYCESLNTPMELHPSYYQFSPCAGYRFISLDTYDMSVHGYDTESKRYKESLAILRSWNKNEQWNSPVGLGDKSHVVAFNGGVGKDQLTWLRKQLEDATRQKDRVVIFAHVPFYSPPDPVNRVWNFEEVLGLLHEYDVVVAVFCGHRHEYDYARDDRGIHHVVLPGIVEIPPGQNAHVAFYSPRDRVCRVWNFEEVLGLLHEYDVVVAVFCGHAHFYDYARVDRGINHVVLPGIVEIPPIQNGYATLDVHADRLHVRGVGKMGTLTLEF